MGGPTHQHVPDYRAFDNWRQFPELVQYARKLDAMGLKDPWIRNFSYAFDRRQPKMRGPLWVLKELFKPGFRWGLGAAVALIAADETYSYFKHGHTSWNKPQHH